MALIQEVKDGKIVDNTTEATKKKPGNEMGQDQFLQLLVAQMQYQDPLEPASNTEWVAQMATFSMVESLNNMQDSMEEQSANDLVGKYVLLKVTGSTGDVSYVKGKVDYITKQNGKTMLSVDDKLYGLDTLDTVADEEYYQGSVLANELHQMILLLPTVENVALSDDGLIKSAREAYEALTDSQKKFVGEDDLQKLSALETEMDAIKATHFSSLVRALPSESTLKAATGEELAGYRKQLSEAREFYDGMSDRQKENIPEGYADTLQSLEKVLESLAPAQDTDTETDDVSDLLQKILDELNK